MQERISIGNVEILAVVDMYSAPVTTNFFFPDVPEESWEPYQKEQLTTTGEIVVPFCLFVIRSQGRTIMADTGMGAGPHPTEGNQTGNLINELKSIGISPDDVDIVFNTHLHDDHVGWNITHEGGSSRPTFPNAKYLVPRDDWEHYTKPDILALPYNQYIREHVVPLEKLGVMELVDGGHNITSEISTLHTPGHQCILINSQGERGALVADVTHMSMQIEHPDWCSVYDWDKPMGQKSREDLLDQLERDGTVVAAGHFKADQHFGRVVRLQGRRYWQKI